MELTHAFCFNNLHLITNLWNRTVTFCALAILVLTPLRTPHWNHGRPFVHTCSNLLSLRPSWTSFSHDPCCSPSAFGFQRCTLITLLMASLAAGFRLVGNVSFFKLGAILFQMILRSAFVTTCERLTPWKLSVVQNILLVSEESFPKMSPQFPT
jgi:hypothetical protein